MMVLCVDMKAIVAIAKNGVIGNSKHTDLPWPKIPGDFSFFKEKTDGKIVIVGSKTYKTLPPLPNRQVICLTKQKTVSDTWFNYRTRESFAVANSPEAILECDHEDFWLCGGAEIYRLLVPECSCIYVTRVNREADGDVIFPFSDMDLLSMFKYRKDIKKLNDGHSIEKYWK